MEVFMASVGSSPQKSEIPSEKVVQSTSPDSTQKEIERAGSVAKASFSKMVQSSDTTEKSFLRHHWSKFTDWVSDNMPEWMGELIDSIRYTVFNSVVDDKEFGEQCDAYAKTKEFYDSLEKSIETAQASPEDYLLSELDVDKGTFGTFFSTWESLQKSHDKIEAMPNTINEPDKARLSMRLARTLRSYERNMEIIKQSPIAEKLIAFCPQEKKEKLVKELKTLIPSDDELKRRNDLQEEYQKFVTYYPDNPNNERIQRVVYLINAESTWIEMTNSPKAINLPLETLKVWKEGFEEILNNTKVNYEEPPIDLNESDEMTDLKEIANCFTPSLELKESLKVTPPTNPLAGAGVTKESTPDVAKEGIEFAKRMLNYLNAYIGKIPEGAPRYKKVEELKEKLENALETKDEFDSFKALNTFLKLDDSKNLKPLLASPPDNVEKAWRFITNVLRR